ncbi:hypothetical protein [Streptomyces vietnamensis]|uniref:hypothetical protein n=1 Tax=Streptomyces vietnamensis TaxID=362257 RepID=UPI00131B7C41|nr:hypothetical protein [Streptomyces vietnamensis]
MTTCLPGDRDRLEDWTPEAALGLVCTACHPEYRDDASPVRSPVHPDARVETLPGERGEAWCPVATHETAAPATSPRTTAPAALTVGRADTSQPTRGGRHARTGP